MVGRQWLEAGSYATPRAVIAAQIFCGLQSMDLVARLRFSQGTRGGMFRAVNTNSDGDIKGFVSQHSNTVYRFISVDLFD